MTTIFLDFDGVLHPNEVYSVGGKPFLKTEKCPPEFADSTLFCYLPLLIEALCDRRYRIVLSASWVPMLGFDRACSYLPPALRMRVDGATWHSKAGMPKRQWLELPRHEQIAQYVARNPVGDDWFAIDDDDFLWPHAGRDRLVHCADDMRGISHPETYANLLEKILDPALW